MATKTNKTAVDPNMMEDPAQLVEEQEEKQAAAAVKQPKKADEKDARIAELEAQLAEAQKQAAAYQKGDDVALVRKAAAECEKDGTDPWKKEVSIRVPARRDCNDPYYWLCVNGRSVQLPANNQYQTMKLPFAESLINMLVAEKNAERFADDLQVYDPITNPHPRENVR